MTVRQTVPEDTLEDVLGDDLQDPVAAEDGSVASNNIERDRARWISGSTMQAEETSLAPLRDARRQRPYRDDAALTKRFRDAFVAAGNKATTADQMWGGLKKFSAWLQLNKKASISASVFDNRLTDYVWMFVRLHRTLRPSGFDQAPAALDHLRQWLSTGTAPLISQIEREGRGDIPEEDEWFVDEAFHNAVPNTVEYKYRVRLRSLSAWLHDQNKAGLSDPDHLHSDELTEEAKVFERECGGAHVIPALNQLRTFDLTGSLDLNRYRDSRRIPELDQRLIQKFKEDYADLLRKNGEILKKDKTGRDDLDRFAGFMRRFSGDLRKDGFGTVASLLHDPMLDEHVQNFIAENKNVGGLKFKGFLNRMRSMFPRMSPEAAIGRIGLERFVHALGAFTTGGAVGDVARSVGAEESDLRVFLDERSPNGLTPAGVQVLESLEGRLRQAADANVILLEQQRQQREWQWPSQLSPFQPPQTPSGGWPSFGWMQDQVQQPSPFPYEATGPSRPQTSRGTFDLESIESVPQYTPVDPGRSASRASRGTFDLESIESVPQYTPADPGRSASRASRGTFDLESIESVPQYRGFDLNTPSEEVDGPDRSAAPARSSSTFNDLESLSSQSAHYLPAESSYAGAYGYDTGTSALAGPSGVPDQAQDLGYIVGAGWRHGNQLATPVLINALDNLNLRPSPYMPQTMVQIHGERYTAQFLQGGGVWLAHAASAPRSLPELDAGPIAGGLDAFFRRHNVERGIASGRGLNCLLDTLLQFVHDTRRQGYHETPQTRQLGQQVQLLRGNLAQAGLVDATGEIDLYEGAAGAYLAASFGLRIQAIENHADGRVTVHPVIGQGGRLVHILHTPGHFQPLWPRQG